MQVQTSGSNIFLKRDTFKSRAGADFFRVSVLDENSDALVFFVEERIFNSCADLKPMQPVSLVLSIGQSQGNVRVAIQDVIA